MKINFLIFILIIGYSVSAFGQSKQEVVNTKPKPQVVVQKKVAHDESVQVINKVSIYSEEYRIQNSIPDDFPRYVNTGNEKQDEANYYDAKQEWIRNNPDRFEKIKHIAL